jgi:hypothetical protein
MTCDVNDDFTDQLWNLEQTRYMPQVASDHKAWGPAAVEEMEILTPQPSRHPFMPLDYNSRKGRFTSLYEETPLTGILC